MDTRHLIAYFVLALTVLAVAGVFMRQTKNKRAKRRRRQRDY